MTKEEVLSWAKENNHLSDVYVDVKFVGTIDKNDVYVFIARSDVEMDTGLPRLVIIENGEPKKLIGKEAFEILHKLDKED